MKNTIRIKYPSAERFRHIHAQIRKGKILLPLSVPLPTGTLIALKLNLDGIQETFQVDGVVTQFIDKKTAARLKIPPGIGVRLQDEDRTFRTRLDHILGNSEAYKDLPNLISPPAVVDPANVSSSGEPTSTDADQPRPIAVQPMAGAAAPAHQTAEVPIEPAGETGLSLDWIRTAVSQEKTPKTEAAPPEDASVPVAEKKTLAAEERDRIKPAGDFIMDLTKAMLRSGYYAADHPGAKNAKQGLHDALQTCLQELGEIMISNQEVEGKTDIFIMGILDEPVSIRTLVGAGMSELFVPKLQEYFNRNGLVSFAIKRDISLENFERFVDIMSDPRTDSGEGAGAGKILSQKLVAHGITEISAVFVDDMIALEENLPWRVEMAIQRLAKDLKVLPMFQGKSDEAIARLKLQNIQDIIRPLRHPEFLKDLVINCYVIARHVEHMKSDEIEQAIVAAFPLQTLLPTSKFIFDELQRLKDFGAQHADSAVLGRRMTSVKRILKWISNRLVLEDAPGARSFLEQLYRHAILTFEELPADVQYLINTMKMVDELRTHAGRYAEKLIRATTAEEADVLLELFRRAIPALVESGDWPALLTLADPLRRVAETNPVFSTDTGALSQPLRFAFSDAATPLIEAYLNADASLRASIEAVVAECDTLGVEILGKAFLESDRVEVQKHAADFLVKQGDAARCWARDVLADEDSLWQHQKKALFVLGCVGGGDGDVERAHQLFAHSHPQVRDEALNALINLASDDAEPFIVAGLADDDDKVRWRAATALNNLAVLSEAGQSTLLEMIKDEAPEPEQLQNQARPAGKLIQLIRALAGRSDLAYREQFEALILDIARKCPMPEKGFLKRLKKSENPDATGILLTVVQALGNIGGPDAEVFLAGLAKGKSAQAKTAGDALAALRNRSTR
jgi:HEAT repeat protein